MNIAQLQEFYNKIDSCSVALDSELSFAYIQSQITKVALYTEQLNHYIGEILVEQTRLEHIITDTNFEYELKFTQYMMDNSEVKALSTAKERKDYINYFLMKEEYRNILNLQQELKDVTKLLELANKKAKDLDRTYPKLKTLWESLHVEVKNVQKFGSDSEHIDRVRNSITNGSPVGKPVFADDTVEEILNTQYHEESIKLEDKTAKINDTASHIVNTSIEKDVDDLLADL